MKTDSVHAPRHPKRHHAAGKASVCSPPCLRVGDDDSLPFDGYDPKGPGGGGYPGRLIPPPPDDPDDDFGVKGPGGGGYPIINGSPRPPRPEGVHGDHKGYYNYEQGDLNLIG